MLNMRPARPSTRARSRNRNPSFSVFQDPAAPNRDRKRSFSEIVAAPPAAPPAPQKLFSMLNLYKGRIPAPKAPRDAEDAQAVGRGRAPGRAAAGRSWSRLAGDDADRAALAPQDLFSMLNLRKGRIQEPETPKTQRGPGPLAGDLRRGRDWAGFSMLDRDKAETLEGRADVLALPEGLKRAETAPRLAGLVLEGLRAAKTGPGRDMRRAETVGPPDELCRPPRAAQGQDLRRAEGRDGPRPETGRPGPRVETGRRWEYLSMRRAETGPRPARLADRADLDRRPKPKTLISWCPPRSTAPRANKMTFSGPGFDVLQGLKSYPQLTIIAIMLPNLAHCIDLFDGKWPILRHLGRSLCITFVDSLDVMGRRAAGPRFRRAHGPGAGARGVGPIGNPPGFRFEGSACWKKLRPGGSEAGDPKFLVRRRGTGTRYTLHKRAEEITGVAHRQILARRFESCPRHSLLPGQSSPTHLEAL